jgi:hypothetical protein
VRRPKRYDVSVFLNCPFDDGYRPLLHAALFAIQDCGFIARTALEDVGSGETRLDKIVRIIGGSRYSIHDISRVEVGADNPLPRFNMPFECGLSFGAAAFSHPARAQGRDLLVLAGEPFQDKRTLSDLAGQDAKYHGGSTSELIRAVRSFLAAKAKTVLPPQTGIRGHSDIVERFERFKAEVEALAKQRRLRLEEINSFDYVPDWLSLAVRWQAATA